MYLLIYEFLIEIYFWNVSFDLWICNWNLIFISGGSASHKTKKWWRPFGPSWAMYHKQGRKYRDISTIYRQNIVYRRVSTRYFMEKYRSGNISWRNIGPAIFHGEISVRRFLAIYRRFLVINRRFLAINRRFFSDISCGQRWSTKVWRTTVSVNALQCCYSASPFACCREDLNPKPPGLTCPLIHNMQQIYIYIYLNSLYKENIRIF